MTEPVNLIPLLPPTDPRLRDAARVYGRAFPLPANDPEQSLRLTLRRLHAELS